MTPLDRLATAEARTPKRRTVALHMEGRVDLVEARVLRRGLALHPQPELCGRRTPWSITHVASGLAVLKWIPTRSEGERLLRRLLTFADWTRDAAALKADKRLVKRVRPIWDRLLKAE